MMPADLNFGAPIWLWGLTAIPALVVLFFHAERQSRRRLIALLPAPRLRAQLTGTASVARRRWRYAFLLLGLAGLLVTLAQPRLGYETRETHRRGLDVIVVVDVSKSMLATDVAPSRLMRGKLALHDLVLDLDGDRLGLVAFAGSAFLQAPLTTDYDAVLRAVDEGDTNLIPLGGTNIGAGINLALEAFGKAEAGNRAILLLSDGEPTADSDQADGVKAAGRAAEEGVKVFTLGFGTPEGSLIPLEGSSAGELVRDADGQLVRTRLNESGLREIAQAGGGFYVRFENGGLALRTVIQDGLSRLKTAEIDARTSRRPIERYQWPLGVALAALSLAGLLGERRKTRAPAAAARRRPIAAAVLAWALLGVCLGVTAPASPALAAGAPDESHSSALDLYRAGRYDQAYHAFEDLARQHPKIGDLQFDAGASAYMAKRYDQALDAFGEALTSDDPSLQAKSHYNFANTLFRRGEQQQEQKEKISDWRDAIQHYNTVLSAIKTQPPHSNDSLASNTTYNRDIVQRRLDAELKQPPQTKKQDQQNQSPEPNQSGAGEQQPGQGLKQPGQDQQPSPSPAQPGQPGQSHRQDNPPTPPPTSQSVPNQDKPRQRGDFKAQPGSPAGETPKEPSSRAGQDAPEENGKMSPDQARALLQSLKDEDTTVNLNEDPDDSRKRNEPVIKDW